MERWEATLNQALKQVELAKIEELYIRVPFIGMAIENFLKAVLMNAGKYVDVSRGGDRHHICLELFRKIKNEGCLDNNLIEEMYKILINNRLIYTDQSLLNVETTAGFYPNIRYPIETDGVWISIVENLSPEILQEKYELLIKFSELIRQNL
jgi:hypothetical protein